MNKIVENINYRTDTKCLAYDEFLNDRLKKLYSRKKQYKNVDQLYSRVEFSS